jgi:hypothetical protein
MSLRAPAAGAMSANSPAAGAMSTSRPDARSFVGSDSNSVSTAAAAPQMRMLWQNTTTGDRSIWLMNGTSWDGSYALLPQVPTAWSIAGSGDFNFDGYADIVWQNTSTGDRSIWFMSGNNWNGEYALLPRVSTEWSIAGVGDFNADGKPDLVWQNTTTGDRSIWFMNGSSWNGSYALLPQVATAWSIAAIGDFNADGKPDLVWQNNTTGDRSIWYMNGSTWSGSYASLMTVPPAWRIAAAADFDSDGDPDLVWQNISTGERSIWMMNGSSWNGSYVSLPTVSTQWSIAAMLEAPVNGHLVINEIDYDQIGTDNAEFVEIYNPTSSALSLDGLALVFVNGADNAEYLRVSLSGVLASGQYAVVGGSVVTSSVGAGTLTFTIADGVIQNGSPDGVALVDTRRSILVDALSYEGPITAANIVGLGTVSLVEGTALPTGVADSNTQTGSLIRNPNGTDTDNAASDWRFTTTLTPGYANQCTGC